MRGLAAVFKNAFYAEGSVLTEIPIYPTLVEARLWLAELSSIRIVGTTLFA